MIPDRWRDRKTNERCFIPARGSESREASSVQSGGEKEHGEQALYSFLAAMRDMESPSISSFATEKTRGEINNHT